MSIRDDQQLPYGISPLANALIGPSAMPPPLQGDIPAPPDKNMRPFQVAQAAPVPLGQGTASDAGGGGAPAPAGDGSATAPANGGGANAAAGDSGGAFEVTFAPPDRKITAAFYDDQSPLKGSEADLAAVTRPDNPYVLQPIPLPGGAGTRLGIPQQNAVDLANKQFDDNAVAANAAHNQMLSLDTIKQDLAVLNDPNNRNWNSGSMLGAKVEVAKWINGIEDFIDPKGTSLKRIDPDAIKSLESFNKATTNLGFGNLSGTTGAQQTLEHALSAVPHGGLSPAGNKLVVSILEQLAQRAIQKHGYQVSWQTDPSNKNALNVGSNDAFEKHYPTEMYINRAVYNATVDPAYLKNLKDDLQGAGNDPAARLRAEQVFDHYTAPGMAKFAETQFGAGPNGTDILPQW